METHKVGTDFEVPRKGPRGAGTTGWLFLCGILGVSLLVLAIFYVWIYVQQVQSGYKLAKLYEQHDKLLAVQRKLRLEWSRFEDPTKLEEIGRERYGLAPPRPDQKLLAR
jgi:hypothetical protein